MDTFLWVVQWALAALFVMAGLMKVLSPAERLLADPRMDWVRDVGVGQAKLAGVTELLGAAGLLLPGLLDVAGWLTPVAAGGLAVQMVLAARLHQRREETQFVAMTAVLAVVALVVVIGRVAEPL